MLGQDGDPKCLLQHMGNVDKTQLFKAGYEGDIVIPAKIRPRHTDTDSKDIFWRNPVD